MDRCGRSCDACCRGRCTCELPVVPLGSGSMREPRKIAAREDCCVEVCGWEYMSRREPVGDQDEGSPNPLQVDWATVGGPEMVAKPCHLLLLVIARWESHSGLYPWRPVGWRFP
eukprot:3835784-Prorocentrum_lima.AAC.1